MFSTIWAKLCLFFSTSKIGVILKVFISKAASSIIKQICDKDNQQKAYEFVKELNARKDLTTEEKAKEFNKKMAEWAKTVAKEVLSNSIINCLREMAVAAVKAENIE